MISPIFSMLDPVELSSEGMVFQCLGYSHEGYHVVVTFKKLVGVPLVIDHKNPTVLNRFCTMYNLENKRGTHYGYLFVLDKDKLKLVSNRMVLRCNVRDTYDFEPLTITNEKNRLLFYRSSSGCALITIVGKEAESFLIHEV